MEKIMDALTRTNDTPKVRTDFCEQHGTFEARHIARDLWSGCSACWRDAEQRRQEAEKAKRRAERVEAMLLWSGVVGRFTEASFDNFIAATDQQRHVLDTCRSYIANFKEGCWGAPWLVGSPGTGKTHLGAAMVSTLIREHCKSSHITTARGIVRRIRATWSKPSDERESEVLDELVGADLLVLDEAGVGFGSDSELVQLLDVVDARYQLERPIVVISNLAPSQLAQALGDRVYDRLREGATLLPCDWKSHRKA